MAHRATFHSEILRNLASPHTEPKRRERRDFQQNNRFDNNAAGLPPWQWQDRKNVDLRRGAGDWPRRAPPLLLLTKAQIIRFEYRWQCASRSGSASRRAGALSAFFGARAICVSVG
ncbi:MAG TPA: hypothetical protein VKV96_18530 [Roseiarcus sp.]|nr:hypothetical protein [Roseiarcus sp.]